MIRLAANLSFLFTELPFLDRFAAAAAAGFTAVEWTFAYDQPLDRLSAELRRHGLALALFNAPPGDLAAGEAGLATHPGRQDDFDQALDLALRCAAALDAPIIHLLAGRTDHGSGWAERDQLFLQNLTRAADRAAEHGVSIAIEPLNRRDWPDYHLATVDHALRVIEAAGRSNIGLQLDLYHQQLTGGDVIRTIDRAFERLIHVQVAGAPNRDEPSRGELAMERVLQHLDGLGYAGFVGCEYKPAAGTLAGLAWARPYLENKA